MLIVTSRALYNCKTGALGKCKRRIPLELIEAITQSTVSDEFVVHVPAEYDYRFRGPRKAEAIEWLQTARERVLGSTMAVHTTNKIALNDYVTTKPEAKKAREAGYGSEGGSGEAPPPPPGGSAAAGVDTGADLMPISEEGEDAETDDDSAPPELEDTAARDRSQTTGWSSSSTRVTMEDFMLVKVLGRGSFGKVIAARKKGGADAGTMYAIKVLSKKLLAEREQIEHTQAEREILESMDHPFLVGLKYAFQTPTKLYMVLPLYNGGELFTILKKQRRFSEDRTKFYAAEIALGLGHLHSNGIIYRDLKPENLLLDKDGHIGLTDFGLSKRVSVGDSSYTFCGTPEYLAPEIIADLGHDKEVDWWSYGVLVYEMIAGRPAFYASNHQKMYELITRGKLVFTSSFSDECKDFVTKLLQRDPTKRLGAGAVDVEALKAHPWFAEIDFAALQARAVRPPYVPNVKSDEDFGGFDATFTSEVAVDSYAPASELAGDAFQGFTFAEKSALAGK